MLNYAPAALIILSVFLSVFVGILMNRRDTTALREDMNRQFSEFRFEIRKDFGEVNRRLELIEGDQKQFVTITGKMEGRIDELSKR